MSLETITVYKDTYDSAIRNEFDYMTQLAELRGTIIALASIAKTDSEFVETRLQELAQKFEKKVDIVA